MTSFTLTSPAFLAGGPIPAKYTADRLDISPPLMWSEPPEKTLSLALIADDPDAPDGTWVHWVLTGIPADYRSLPEGIEKIAAPHGMGGAMSGMNDFGKLGYGGPAPPRGDTHRYYFKLYALGSPIRVAQGATKAHVEAAMKGHVLAESMLMGTYQRK